ncbi:MAG TPA: N-acetyltransferase [Thermoanaerobaculia bacterium]|nr:N-acetyltransferase [Thermoanaerobaculia bacterium]
MNAIQIDRVDSSRALRDFVDLPFRIYADDKDWAAPLKSDVRWMLDLAKNPFWKHAKRELFLARRDGKVLGRIAAIVDDEHNRVHGEKIGFFGFFESEDDREVAAALFRAAEAWVRGVLPEASLLRGPVNPSLNDEAGALVPSESEPGLPFIMMTYNPAYYLDLFGAAGYAKVKDLVAILAPVDDRSFERLRRVTDIVKKREKGRAVVRQIRMDKFDEDLAIVKDLYNRSWEKNWGFVPMTSDEIDAMAKKLKPILYPPWVLFVELDGKPVGFHLALKDYNQVLKELGGSLFPFGWLKFLLLQKKIDRVRTLALGILPEYRRRGFDALLYFEAVKEGVRLKYTAAEFSWLLEDNLDIQRPLEVFGGRIYRRYRIVERSLA